MILPTIHSNGTGAEDLAKGFIEAYRAVEAARDALRKMEFNARDYYVQGPEAWPQAVAEMRARHEALDKMSTEMMSAAVHCQDAADDKAKRMAERYGGAS